MCEIWKWKKGMKVGLVYQKGRQTCARVTNQTVHGEIPVTGACNHRSTDVGIWEAEAEVEQRRGGGELLRGIKGSFVTRESETQQENTAAWQLKFTVWLQLHSPASWLGKLQLNDFPFSSLLLLLLLCQLSQKQNIKVSGSSVSLHSSTF